MAAGDNLTLVRRPDKPAEGQTGHAEVLPAAQQVVAGAGEGAVPGERFLHMNP